MTRIIKDIDTAVKEIMNGNVIGLPTETVYGLAANALNENAVMKIFETKDRPRFNPLIVHVSGTDAFEMYGENIPDDVYSLAEKFSPGPIAYIVKKKKVIPDITTAGNDSVALRIPSHEMFREVLLKSGVPLAAPSANRSGKISPTSAEDVLSELEGKINYILDGGRCEVGIESTVISFIDGEARILRYGAVTKKEIEDVIGKTVHGNSGKLVSPGQLKSHYAPMTPLYILDDPTELKNIKDNKMGVLDFSVYNNVKEIALNLYSDLSKLDKMNYDIIVCSKVDDEGLGIAINDRLERASSGKVKFEDNEIKIITE
ncbi:MAG: L-threonylcarbamoyladenylate synthase [Ignavibacteria bacterium]